MPVPVDLVQIVSYLVFGKVLAAGMVVKPFDDPSAEVPEIIRRLASLFSQIRKQLFIYDMIPVYVTSNRFFGVDLEQNKVNDFI